MAASFHLSLDAGALNALLQSPQGPVGVYVRRVAVETADVARRTAPRRSGRLASSIVVNRGPLNSMEVTADVAYALAVHQGSPAQTVTSSKPMAFPRKGGGPKVVVHSVNRPAIKGRPFLLDALKQTIATM